MPLLFYKRLCDVFDEETQVALEESGGMLLCFVAYLRHHGQEWRNVKLFGQERNLMTSSIARMNCFLHEIEDFRIGRGDTLSEPKFVEGDKLRKFDVVLANPPYSIKQWDRSMFSQDPRGRSGDTSSRSGRLRLLAAYFRQYVNSDREGVKVIDGVISLFSNNFTFVDFKIYHNFLTCKFGIINCKNNVPFDSSWSYVII